MHKKRNIFVLLIFSFLGFYATAQTIEIIDRTTLQPIENVCIVCKSGKHSITTNENGEARLKAFKKGDTLSFTHQSYHTLRIAYTDLEQIDFKLKMRERPIMLNPFVLSFNRRKVPKKEVPNKIITISNVEIKFNEPQTSADVLKQSNQVFVQKSQLGGGSPMLRGFATNSVLLVVDGVRMNNAIYRSGNLQNVISLDAHSIDNVEVILGPGSVIYGSDALGGVMNFSLKKPQLSDKDKPFVKSNAFMRYSSANAENTVHFDFNYGQKKWASLTSVSFSKYHDLRTGSVRPDKYSEWGKRYVYAAFINGKDTLLPNSDPNVQVGSGYDQLNLMQKIKYEPNKNVILNYHFNYSTTSDIPRYDRLIVEKNGGLKYAEWNYGPQQWMLNALNIDYHKKNKFFDVAQIIVANQFYEESRYTRKFNDSSRTARIEDVSIVSINIDFDKELSKKTMLYYGLESVYNGVSSSAYTQNIYDQSKSNAATRYPDGGSSYHSSAIYASVKSNFREKLTFIFGSRYTLTSVRAHFLSNSFYDFPFSDVLIRPNAFNGSVSVVYRPYKNLQLNYNLSSGFRAPNVDDIAKVFDSEPGSVVVPNAGLKPEYAYNADFGLIKNFYDVVKMEVSVFYTHLTNAMVRRDFMLDGKDSIMYDGELSRVQAIVNLGEAVVYGGSLSITAELSDNFSFTSNLSHIHGEDMIEEVPMRHIPPLFGSSRLSYKREQFRIDFYINYNGTKTKDQIAPEEQSKTYLYAPDGSSPGWYTLNLKGSYQFNSQIQLNAGIENILDHHYRPYSSGISAPGRNFVVSLKASI